MSLEELKEEVLNCNKCSLSKTRNSVIFGEGNSYAPIVIIAEAPGKDEDLQGRPFVGYSGQLLDKILDACGFTRTRHVYISNILKCRPPGNRTPLPEEIELCKPFLLQQIELINPKILILLGATALKTIIGPEMRITKIRGQWINCENRLAIPVYHPSALLRNPALKRDTWEDFKKIVFKYRQIVDHSHYSPHV
ncbi:MAG: uracil-DNA glycosylase [Bacteroidetes bacterium]|nr:uracil-DNA glycosylase [Bacteroidota bacterium]MBL7110647.1 uracil-DNA glycosylase [Bacteroidales bacterium]